MLELTITWAGPLSPNAVIDRLDAGGAPPEYEGEDYGLYQIYGRHILGDRDALLYVGEAADQTFAVRFQEHQKWLVHEYPVRVFVGRLYVPRRHTCRDSWAKWKADVLLAERILIFTYSPHYNSMSISEPPSLDGQRRVILHHAGERNRLRRQDVVPDSWR